MGYVLLTLIGFAGGGLCVYFAMHQRLSKFEEEKRRQEGRAKQLEELQRSLEEQKRRLNEMRIALERETERFRTAETEFRAKVVLYKELEDENSILKRDLRNLDLNLRKLQLDRESLRQHQEMIDRRVEELASRYLKENVKWIGASLNENNFVVSKQRLQDVVARCRSIGFDVPAEEEAELVANLRAEYEKVLRAAFETQEQARIKAQIREEQMREREIQRELQQLERQREAIRVALEKALAEAHDEYSEEVERLKARLAEAEARAQRALSQAQLTKAGHVYVISNIGSFGENVFKIGMTRRLEPVSRIRELADASVPFPFDVHMMISTEDAPSLENALHRGLHTMRINRVNPRKEFFKTDLEMIVQIVKEHHGEVEYMADPEALEYRQSLTMSEEDQEYIEEVYESLEEELGEAEEESVPVADEA